MSWTVDNAPMNYNDNKLNFIVADLKNDGRPVIVHNYTKIIKVEGKLFNTFA